MNSVKTKDKVKFLVLSLMGALIFFAPLFSGKVPVVFFIETIKNAMGKLFPYIIVASNVLLAMALIGWKVLKKPFFKKYFQGDGVVKSTFYFLSILLVIMVLADVPLDFIQNPLIGGRILPMASLIFLTIALAGTLVIFIIKSGIVESVSILVEPLMRPIFKLPGEAAINMLSSFVSSASVGVFFTEKYYDKGTYTTREAVAVVTNFSVISVGYIGVLASIAGIEEYYGTLLVSSFVLVLLMAIVMIRIPPLTRFPSKYVVDRSFHGVTEKIPYIKRLPLAMREGALISREFTPEAFLKNFLQALKFAQKTVGIMVPTVTFVLILVYYTPLFTWLGTPLIPLLKLLGIQDASVIAPSVLIGIVEVSLPSILISGTNIAKASAFFVVQLSIVQIIFFSEAGNAILSSKIPLKAFDLILIFFIRTLLALPLVAVLTYLLF